MAKVGDKYVIEIDSVLTTKKGTLYVIKGFKSLVFDEYGLEKLEKYNNDKDISHQGEKAWRLADTLFSIAKNYDLATAFPEEWRNGGYSAIVALPYDVALKKWEDYLYPPNRDIVVRVGDEMVHKICDEVGIYTGFVNYKYQILLRNGTMANDTEPVHWKKTGRHFDLDKILGEIGNDKV